MLTRLIIFSLAFLNTQSMRTFVCAYSIYTQAQTHDKTGERVKYFAADGEDLDVHELAQRERLGLDDFDSEFVRMAGKNKTRTTDDYDLDDMFVDRAAKGINRTKQHERARTQAIKGIRIIVMIRCTTIQNVVMILPCFFFQLKSCILFWNHSN